MALLVSPLAHWLHELRWWLFLHGHVWLALHLTRIVSGVLRYGFWALWLGEMAREFWVLFGVPARANRLILRGETDRGVRLLRRAAYAFAPLVNNRPLWLRIHFRLGQVLESVRRTGEANAVWEEILQRPKLPLAFEVQVRKRLANGLETVADLAGAAQQQARLDELFARSGTRDSEHWTMWHQRGLHLADAHRYNDAIPPLERALAAAKPELLPAQLATTNTEIAARLALAAHSAGDASKSERAARQALELSDQPFWRGQSFRTLALALGAQNRLEEAIEAASSAVRETEREGNPDRIADALGTLAMYQTQRGEVKTALLECDRALSIAHTTLRVPLHLSADCCFLLGDYAGARERLERARRAPVMPSPVAERQMQGLFDMAQAGYEQAATRCNGENRARESWDLLQRAKPKIAGFERLELWLEAAEALSLALLGEQDAAKARCEPLAARLSAFQNDGATLSTVWSTLARVSLVVGDHEEALKWWRLYLESSHAKPVYRARALCDCGESKRAVGDEEGARKCWEEVVASGFDTADTKQAQAFLKEVPAKTETLSSENAAGSSAAVSSATVR